MANTREIRRRIRSVENTAKITNAIQLVAASKMRRAQDRALQARPYAEKMRAVLGQLSTVAGDPDASHPLLERREINETAVILITPDRGLCGGLIANLERHTGEIVLGPSATGAGELSMIPVGRKGADYFRRFGVNFRATFQDIGDYPGLAETQPISRIAIDDYVAGRVDQVILVYASFINTVTQEPVSVPILPVEPPASDDAMPRRRRSISLSRHRRMCSPTSCRATSTCSSTRPSWKRPLQSSPRGWSPCATPPTPPTT